MSKRRSWLCLIKSLFFQDSHHPQEKHKRSKRKRWFLGRAIGNKCLLPAPQSVEIAATKPVAEQIQSKFEGDATNPIPKCEQEQQKCLESSTNESTAFPLDHQQILAAIKIQTSYRGYLARKALKALKGFVRLQAIIRGTAVRRQAMATLKCLQAIVNIQSEVCTRRCVMVQSKDSRDEKPKAMQQIESKGYKRMDDGLLSKEEEIDIILRKKEATLRRQRTKAYSFNHRHPTDSEDGKAEGRLRYWLEQYVNDQTPKNNNKLEGKQFKLRNLEGLNNPHILYLPRRSFHNHRKQSSYGEDNLHPSSPGNIPAYMAATESAKAKTRSLSSPRVRPMHFEAYSDSDSPYKHKLISPMSSINSEVTCLSRISHKSTCSSQQKSPSFEGLSAPVRSSRNFKDFSLESGNLLVNRG